MVPTMTFVTLRYIDGGADGYDWWVCVCGQWAAHRIGQHHMRRADIVVVIVTVNPRLAVTDTACADVVCASSSLLSTLPPHPSLINSGCVCVVVIVMPLVLTMNTIRTGDDNATDTHFC